MKSLAKCFVFVILLILGFAQSAFAVSCGEQLAGGPGYGKHPYQDYHMTGNLRCPFASGPIIGPWARLYMHGFEISGIQATRNNFGLRIRGNNAQIIGQGGKIRRFNNGISVIGEDTVVTGVSVENCASNGVVVDQLGSSVILSGMSPNYNRKSGFRVSSGTTATISQSQAIGNGFEGIHCRDADCYVYFTEARKNLGAQILGSSNAYVQLYATCPHLAHASASEIRIYNPQCASMICKGTDNGVFTGDIGICQYQ